MNKSRDAFRTISEVADWLDTPAHVLRFWESKFTQVKPVKRAGGRRYYRPADMSLLGGIKQLLHDDGMTIKGVQKVLREKGVKHVAALSGPVETDAEVEAEIVVEAQQEVVVEEARAVSAGGGSRRDAPMSFRHASAEDDLTPEPAKADIQIVEDDGLNEDGAELLSDDTSPATADSPHEDDTAPEALTEPPEQAAAAPQTAALPSFMSRAAPTSQDAKADADADQAETVVDTPNVPDPVLKKATEQPPAAGPLSHLAKIDNLTEEQKRRILPLLSELREISKNRSQPRF